MTTPHAGPAFDALDGLSVGDALGARFFVPATARTHLAARNGSRTGAADTVPYALWWAVRVAPVPGGGRRPVSAVAETHPGYVKAPLGPDRLRDLLGLAAMGYAC
ncbi:hypothetical protein ABZW10_32110 [Kitasatospora sp. NPDC004723]|uniref:hypothetical protein n=1 Tax=Kitasatospora sp. NPDC004723 TaxID=3154288 RepID=UPI0033BB52A1